MSFSDKGHASDSWGDPNPLDASVQMRTSALSKMPFPLKSDEDQARALGMPVPVGTKLRFADPPMQPAYDGVRALVSPSSTWDQRADGVSGIIRGVGQSVAPIALPAALMAAPVEAAVGIAGGTAGGIAAHDGIRALGGGDGIANLGGDLFGAALGGVVGAHGLEGVEPESVLAKVPDDISSTMRQGGRANASVRGNGVIYTNTHGMQVVRDYLGALTGQSHADAQGLALHPDVTEMVGNDLSTGKSFDDSVSYLMQQGYTRKDADTALGALRDGVGGHDIPVIVNAEHARADDLLSHELIHREQFGLSPTKNISDHAPSDAVLMHPVMNIAAQKLSSMGYGAKNLASEASTWLASGFGDLLGIDDESAMQGLTHYFDTLFRIHGDKAFNVLNESVPKFRERLQPRYGDWQKPNHN